MGTTIPELMNEMGVMVFRLSFKNSLITQPSFKSSRPNPVAMGRRGAIGALFALSFLFVGTAHAHKVNVFAYLEGNQVYVQGYFMDGKKAKKSTVIVYGEKGERLTEGLTNDEGEYVFPVSAKQEVRIVLNAGQGHQAEYVLSTGDMVGDEVSKAGSASAAEIMGNQSAVVGGDVDAVVRHAVAAGMMPLAKEIAELKERRSFSDIIGGVGFIAGILGVFAYVKSRKQLK